MDRSHSQAVSHRPVVTSLPLVLSWVCLQWAGPVSPQLQQAPLESARVAVCEEMAPRLLLTHSLAPGSQAAPGRP